MNREELVRFSKDIYGTSKAKCHYCGFDGIVV